MTTLNKKISFGRKVYYHWLRLIANNRPSPFDVYAIHPSEAHHAWTSQHDLKNAMIEMVLQMIKKRLESPVDPDPILMRIAKAKLD